VLALAIILLWRHHRSVAKELTETLDYEKKWRLDEYDRLNERHWELSCEVRSGFEELGLKRTTGRPAIGPGWVKPQ
jgi:hypothetical protein